MAFDLTVLQSYGVSTEVLNRLPAITEGNFTEDFGESITRLSVKGYQFSLVTAGTATPVPGSEQGLYVVIVAEGPHDHNSWFRNPYDSNAAEASRPEAVWYEGEPIPEVVPPALRVKDANGRLNWSRRRRLIMIVLDANGRPLNGLDPIIWDASASSLYGKDLAGGLGLSYAHYRAWCKQHRLVPCVFLTKLVFDRTGSVPSVRFVPVTDPTTGAVRVFPNDLLASVLDIAGSERVKELVKVQRVDGTQQTAAPAQLAPQPAYGQGVPPQQFGGAPAPQPVAPNDYVAPAQTPVQQTVQTATVAPQATVAPTPQPAPAPAQPAAQAPQDLVQTATAELAGADADLASLLASAAMPTTGA